LIDFFLVEARMSSVDTAKKEAQRISRNVLYAAGLRVVVGIIKALLKRGFSSALLSSLLSEFFSLDPLKWGAFVGGLSCVRNIENI
jgi:hypothetical protein